MRFALSVLLVAGLGVAAAMEAKPNFLIILADDMGFSDAGCYGGEIETPNLDALAKGGLRFTQFYNTARCWPTRGALLTGYYAQQIRRDEIPGAGGGGKGERPKWAQLLPVYLKPLGYRSYHSGKWHVDGLPMEQGFDRSYLLQDQDRYFSPRVHYEDDVKLPPVQPDSGYYATRAIADHALKCLAEHEAQHKSAPFFHYLAFTCPHFPLQALPEDIAKYRGRFSAGWDALRARRHERMREMGIVSCVLSPRTAGVASWAELSAADKKDWEQRMEVHAAMIDRMDQEIGRVIAQIKAMGACDNTVIFFLSDNGASAERLVRGEGHDANAPEGSWRWYRCLEPGWANLANTPLRYSKIYVHEGGIATPLIAHWPAGIAAKGELRRGAGHVIDVAPTVLELAGIPFPKDANGTAMPPQPGRSLTVAFANDEPLKRDSLWWLHQGNKAIRMGDWKLVSEKGKGWELYNLGRDRGELHDLSAPMPDKVKAMEQAWNEKLEQFRKDAGW